MNRILPGLLSAIIWTLLLGNLGHAQSAEQKGHAIAEKAEVLTDRYNDFTADGRMALRTGGGESTREFSFKAQNVSGGNRNILVFSWPGDIRDTGLLTIAASGRRDDQWIYLPAAHSVKRISSSSRSGSFVGSEFAYEDMIDQGLGDFSYLWIKDEGCCHIVERFPTYASGYQKQVVWYNRGTGLPDQIEYFPKRGNRSKVLQISGYRSYGGVWRPSQMVMTNLLNGRSTALTWSSYRFNVGLPSSDFSTRALERGE